MPVLFWLHSKVSISNVVYMVLQKLQFLVSSKLSLLMSSGPALIIFYFWPLHTVSPQLKYPCLFIQELLPQFASMLGVSPSKLQIIEFLI